MAYALSLGSIDGTSDVRYEESNAGGTISKSLFIDTSTHRHYARTIMMNRRFTVSMSMLVNDRQMTEKLVRHNSPP